MKNHLKTIFLFHMAHIFRGIRAGICVRSSLNKVLAKHPVLLLDPTSEISALHCIRDQSLLQRCQQDLRLMVLVWTDSNEYRKLGRPNIALVMVWFIPYKPVLSDWMVVATYFWFKSHDRNGEKCMEIVRTLHFKIFPFGRNCNLVSWLLNKARLVNSIQS